MRPTRYTCSPKTNEALAVGSPGLLFPRYYCQAQTYSLESTLAEMLSILSRKSHSAVGFFLQDYKGSYIKDPAKNALHINMLTC